MTLRKRYYVSGRCQDSGDFDTIPVWADNADEVLGVHGGQAAGTKDRLIGDQVDEWDAVILPDGTVKLRANLTADELEAALA